MRNIHDRHLASLGWALHGAGCLTLLAVVGAYYLFVTCHLQSQIQVGVQRIAQLELCHEKAPNIRAAYIQSQAELNALQESVSKTLQRVPENLDEEEFIAQIAAAAQTSNVRVLEYHFGLTERLESFSTAEVTFQCIGSFASIYRFLDKVDHLPRLTEVSRLEIETDKNLERYPLQVTFVLYFGGSSHDRSMRGRVL